MKLLTKDWISNFIATCAWPWFWKNIWLLLIDFAVCLHEKWQQWFKKSESLFQNWGHYKKSLIDNFTIVGWTLSTRLWNNTFFDNILIGIGYRDNSPRTAPLADYFPLLLRIRNSFKIWGCHPRKINATLDQDHYYAFTRWYLTLGVMGLFY